MTMTCHVLHAGDGYTYLTNQVASADVARSAHDPLVDYYALAGNPPGQWVGSGVAELGMTGQVTEEHMLALFGEGLHPDANALISANISAGMPYRKAVESARLGRRFYQFSQPEVPLAEAVQAAYGEFETVNERRPSVEERREIKERVAADLLAGPDGVRPAPEVVRKYLVDELGKAHQPVAGFDMVFSPVKSVSVLWGLGGREVGQQVEAAHEAAWKAALAYGEREAAFTRIGKNGVAQVQTSGFVATAFVHRDSRCGDPDLHTHVVISNRVRSADGQWRTLDSKQLHRVAVSMSEVYNAALEQGLTQRLGVAWTAVSKGREKRPVREIEGVPQVLITGFSGRRTQVEQGYDRLVADYTARYGHTPPRSVQMQLAQQATLQDRPDKKELKSLDEQVRGWMATGREMLAGQDVRAVLDGVRNRVIAGPAPVDVAELAQRVVDVVSAHRATWTVYHVRAEAIRQLKPHMFATAADREQATEQVVARALGGESVELGITLTPTPVLLQRTDGESIYHRHGSTRYTSQAILDAENRLLTAAQTTTGPVVPVPLARAAIARYEQQTGRTLNAGQRQLVEQFVTCGRALSVGIGPPGAGKSTAMRAVRAAWSSTGGRVLGFAPSAAAASVLGDELGVAADTAHSLVTAHAKGREVDVRQGDLLLVDEAGMAGTRLLDQVQAIAEQHGAVVRLIGDYRQLSAVEAGGALRLLHGEAGGTELVEVHRFRDPAEATAVLQLRVGDLAAVDFYAQRGRLHGGTRVAVLDELYAAWQNDTNSGRTAIMISDSAEVAGELSARAQSDRRAAGLVELDGVRLHDDSRAGVGDRVVTRFNARRMAVLGGADYVKNGDLWDVLDRDDDGTLTVRHARHGGEITLPADYVAQHVELGYAATIHRSQGLTVEISRAYLSPMAAREAALVALSRGTDANHGYLDIETVLATDEPQVLPGDLFYRHREHNPVAAAFATIARRESAELSATEQLRQALDEPYRLDLVVPQYLHALSVHRGPTAAADAAEWIRQALPQHAADVVADPAWPTLSTVLLQLRDHGADPVTLLTQRAAQRPLEHDPADPARSVAQVLHHRLLVDLPTSAANNGTRPELLPGWILTPPVADTGESTEVAELGQWLRDRADAIADRVQHLGEQAADQAPPWSGHLGPVPGDPLDRDAWIACAGHVAAYREAFGQGVDDPQLLPGGERGEAAHARAWVHHYVSTTLTAGTADSDIDTSQARHIQAEQGVTFEQFRDQHNQLLTAWLHAGVRDDADRQQALRVELDALDAAHPEYAERHQRAVDEALARLSERGKPPEAPAPVEAAREERRREVEQALRERTHGTRTDRELADWIDSQRDRIAANERQHAAITTRLTELTLQVEQGDGPAVRAHAAKLAELTQRAELGEQHNRLIRELQDARTEQSTSSARAIHLDVQRESMTRWERLLHPGRHDQLQADTAALENRATIAEQRAAVVRDQMRELAEQAGGTDKLNRAPYEARVAVDHHDRDRQAAQQSDEYKVRELQQRLHSLDGSTRRATTTIEQLQEEKQLRSTMPTWQKNTESVLRTTLRAEELRRETEQREAGRQHGLGHDDRAYQPHLDHHVQQQRGPGLGL